MNEVTKYSLSALCGVLVGLGLGYFLSTKESRRDADREIQEVVEHYRELDAQRRKREAKRVEKAVNERVESLVIEEMARAREAQAIIEVNGYVENEDSEVSENSDPKVPHLIGREEFESHNGHNKVELIYYDGDDILTDSDDMPIHDSDRLVGDCLSHLDTWKTIYVHSPTIHTDLTVTLDDRSYAEVVAGIRESRRRTPRMRDED